MYDIGSDTQIMHDNEDTDAIACKPAALIVPDIWHCIQSKKKAQAKAQKASWDSCWIRGSLV
jgi:hypothetical protein